jgi:hypothetical protein
MITGRLGVS